jgi:AraC family transcriptional regulator
MREYIEFVESEHVGPDGLSELVLTSTQTQWSGFPLEMRRVAASGVLACYSVPLPTLVLCTAGRTQARIQSGREEQYVVLAPDRLCLASAGSEIERVSWSGAHEILVVELCPSRLQPLIGDDDRLATLNISQQFAIEDRQLSALLTTMRAEVRAGCPAGRLYGQSLSLALATYLLNRYPASVAKRETRKLKLSAAQFQRLRDYVEAHLSQDLTLAELTDVVDFSANHLTVLLKNTVGLTPHQYVLRERVRGHEASCAGASTDSGDRPEAGLFQPESFHDGVPTSHRPHAPAVPAGGRVVHYPLVCFARRPVCRCELSLPTGAGGVSTNSREILNLIAFGKF